MSDIAFLGVVFGVAFVLMIAVIVAEQKAINDETKDK